MSRTSCMRAGLLVTLCAVMGSATVYPEEFSILGLKPSDVLSLAGAATAESVGGEAITAAAELTAARNLGSPSRPLNPRERSALTPIFGKLVDTIVLTFNAKLPDKWGGIDFNSVTAMTFGQHIYFLRGDVASMDETQFRHLCHEVCHSRQVALQGRGQLAEFGRLYLEQWTQANYSYDEIAFEKQARSLESSDAVYQAWLLYNGTGQAGTVAANATKCGPWESFRVEKLANGRVAIRALGGAYLTAAPEAGGWRLGCEAKQVGPWEQFEICAQPDGSVALKTSHGRYVTCVDAGGHMVVAQATAVAGWEHLWMMDAGAGRKAFRAPDGKHFLIAEGGGSPRP
jgi:hypothetical protein